MKNTTMAMGLSATIALSAIFLTGCGSSNGSASTRPSVNAGSPTVSSPGGGGASTPGSHSKSGSGSKSGSRSGNGSGSGKAGGSANVASLQMTTTVRDAIKDAYLTKAMQSYPKETQKNLKGPTHTRYGKINGVYYAIGDIGFSDNPVSRQDGPHVWRSRNNIDWEYLGDTGGDICGKVPSRLATAWGKSC